MSQSSVVSSTASRRPLRSSLLHGAGSLFFHSLSLAGRLHPLARPHLHEVEVIRDIPYPGCARPAQRLDVYRPMHAEGRCPVVLYLHGGGFHILSKETHWLMALAFARAGYVVCNVSYRLASEHPYPAALEDASDALAWVARHVDEWGGDARRLVLAGESAGANLATSLALATCYRRPEPYARAAFELGIVPRAVVAGCGILQVSDPGRFARRRRLPWWVSALLNDISEGYLRDLRAGAELADPLLVLERGEPPLRPLPAFFAFAGTRDPILDDTRRLGAALCALSVPHEVQLYPGEVHAFHALVFRAAAQRCWQQKLAFLERFVAEPSSAHLRVAS